MAKAGDVIKHPVRGERILFVRTARDTNGELLHTFWNPFDQPAKVAVEVRPALRMETLAETDFGLARDRKCTKQGEMRLLQAAVTLTEFAPELQLPQRYLRWLVALLAPIGRALGYRPYYEAYGTPPDAGEGSPSSGSS